MSFETNVNSMDDVINKCFNVATWFKNNTVGERIDDVVITAVTSYISKGNLYIELISTNDDELIGYYINLTELINLVDLKLLDDDVYMLKSSNNSEVGNAVSIMNKYSPIHDDVIDKPYILSIN